MTEPGFTPGAGSAGAGSTGGVGSPTSAGAASTVGAASRIAFSRISESPISVKECEAAVSSASAGAVVSFAGVVRDHDEGRGVLTLDYTAHPSADDAITAVAQFIVDEFPGVTIAVAHRVGSLRVGDIALACAVSSAHRAEAFTACARLVDAVKESVPIWKEQGFTDGTTEWVASLG